MVTAKVAYFIIITITRTLYTHTHRDIHYSVLVQIFLIPSALLSSFSCPIVSCHILSIPFVHHLMEYVLCSICTIYGRTKLLYLFNISTIPDSPSTKIRIDNFYICILYCPFNGCTTERRSGKEIERPRYIYMYVFLQLIEHTEEQHFFPISICPNREKITRYMTTITATPTSAHSIEQSTEAQFRKRQGRIRELYRIKN